jgi:hypothetical protein
MINEVENELEVNWHKWQWQATFFPTLHYYFASLFRFDGKN